MIYNIKSLMYLVSHLGRSSVGPNTIPRLEADIWLSSSLSATSFKWLIILAAVLKFAFGSLTTTSRSLRKMSSLPLSSCDAFWDLEVKSIGHLLAPK